MHLQICKSPVFDKLCLKRQHLTKMLLIMKFSVIFLFVACMQVTAKGYSQQVDLSFTSTPVTKIFKSIKKQTGYDFLFTDEMLRDAGSVSISLKKVPLQSALDECLKGLPLEYTIFEKTIVIKRKPPVQPLNPDPVLLINVSGTITDETGNPLAGASVKIKGSNKTTITNEKGEFTIAANPDDKLEFSFIGYQSQEIAVNGRSSLSIVLKIVVQDIDEAIVVGYGTQKKVNLTGAVSSINFESKEMTSRPLVNVSTALEGL